MNVIEIEQLTKDYGHGRGVFDVDLVVKKGQCYGFLGPNGAGKSTTIRHLMGFSSPDKGTAKILGMDCVRDADEIKKHVGYLPGEIAFPKGMRGREFLRFMQSLRGNKDGTMEEKLLETFRLNPDMRIADMSLGVRRKLAVVTAFAHDPEILILDEPTSGLDPMMQQVFIDFIAGEKKRGKTILMSSHIFHEVDAVCDRISIIKEGRIAADFEAGELKNKNRRIYRITLTKSRDYEAFMRMGFQITHKNSRSLTCRLQTTAEDTGNLLQALRNLDIKDFQEIPYTLEDFFMEFYEGGKTFEGVKA